jgi:hypothetical protein
MEASRTIPTQRHLQQSEYPSTLCHSSESHFLFFLSAEILIQCPLTLSLPPFLPSCLPFPLRESIIDNIIFFRAQAPVSSLAAGLSQKIFVPAEQRFDRGSTKTRETRARGKRREERRRRIELRGKVMKSVKFIHSPAAPASFPTNPKYSTPKQIK